MAKDKPGSLFLPDRVRDTKVKIDGQKVGGARLVDEFRGGLKTDGARDLIERGRFDKIPGGKTELHVGLNRQAHNVQLGRGDGGSWAKEAWTSMVRVFNPSYKIDGVEGNARALVRESTVQYRNASPDKAIRGAKVDALIRDPKVVDQAVKNVRKAGIVERTFIAAPAKWVSGNPRKAMAGAAIAATTWLWGKHNDKKKQQELDGYAQQMQMQQMMQPAVMPSYKNTVGADEWASAQSQFRGASQQSGFADRITAERAAAQAQGAQAPA